MTLTMITETIKTATTVEIRDLPSGVGRLPYLTIQPRSVAESSAFNDLIIAVQQTRQSWLGPT